MGGGEIDNMDIVAHAGTVGRGVVVAENPQLLDHREEFFRKWTAFDTYRKVVIH